MKTLVKTVLWIGLVSFSAGSQAESTLILDLQEKLNQQSKAFNEQVAKIEKIKRSDESKQATHWYQQALTLPEDSIDYQYALSKYVNERVKAAGPTIESVVALEQLTSRLQDTISQMRRAVGKSVRKNQQIKTDLSPQFYQQTKQQMLGMKNMLLLLMRDPVINNKPNARDIQYLSESLGDKLIQVQQSQGQKNPEEHFALMEDFLESQSEMISLIREQHEEDYYNLKTLSLSKDVAYSATQVRNLFTSLNGLYNDPDAQQARSQTQELLQRTQENWGQGSTGSNRQDFEAYGERLEQFFADGPY